MSKKVKLFIVVVLFALSTLACGREVNWNSRNGQNATPAAAAPLTAGGGH